MRLLGALLGAAVFFLVYGLRPLNVCDDSWIWSGYVDRDIVQHYAGWVAYRASDTVFPLCIADSLCWPSGISILFTDSIPLFCVIFKLLSPILPETFQFFGIYVLLCFVLQGAFASALLSLFFDNAAANLAGTLLFVCSPIMLERAFRHTSLTSHFLILAALYLYFLNKKEKYRFRWAWLALSAAAAFTHPYFLPMVFAVLFADLVERMLTAKQFFKPAGFLLLNGVAAVLVLWLIGFFHGNITTGDMGYGLFSMNLLSLINPTSLKVDWSLLLPSMDVLYLNENFLYLGLGMLLVSALIFFLLLFKHKVYRPSRYIRSYPILFLCAVLLTAFAITNTISIGTYRLALFPLPRMMQSLCEIFRSSARLFWPVYYLLYLFSIVFIVKIEKRLGFRRAKALLYLVIAVQIIDLAPTFVYKHIDFNNGSPHYDNPAQCDFLLQNAENIDRIITIGDSGVMRGLYLGLYSAQNHIEISDPFAARWDQAQFIAISDEYYQQLSNGNIEKNTLYIFSDGEKFLQLQKRNRSKEVYAYLNQTYYILFSTDSDFVWSADQPDISFTFP